MQAADFLAAFSEEVAGIKGDLARWNAAIFAQDADDAALFEALEAYSAQVERLGSTAEMLGLKGLQQFSARLNENLLALATVEAPQREAARVYFEAWPDLVQAYLAAPSQFEHAEAIAMHCANPACPLPLAEEDSLALMAALTQTAEVQISVDAEEVPARPTVATEDDVSLALPEDVDQAVFDALLQEAPGQATELSALVQRLASGEASREEIKQAKRIAHSFKGSSNIVGIRGLARVAHHTEDILEYLETATDAPPRALRETLLDSAACMEQMVYALLGVEEAPTNAQAVLQSVLDWANRIDAGEVGGEDDIAPATTQSVALTAGMDVALAQTDLSAPTTEAVNESPNAVIESPKAPAAKAQQAATASTAGADAAAALRVPLRTVDEMFRTIGEMSVMIAQLGQQLKVASQDATQLITQNALLQKRLHELETLVDIRGLAAMRGRRGTSDSTIEFDPLEMDQYTELHSATRSLVEEAADARELGYNLQRQIADMGTSLHLHNRHYKDMQHLVMTTRMTPVSSLFPRLNRNVRQTCQQTRKQAELTLSGGEILVDGDMLNMLADPLLHILRNAVDHGIELPVERAERGKAETAAIHVSFERRGQTVIVKCRDDGRGLDYTAIRAKAIERGLMSAEQTVTEAELSRFILLPGFSTRDKVSEISGRGVGMDVVRERLLSMKGSVEITSEWGKGCVVTLRFQASLVSLHALLVRIGEHQVAVPSYGLEQALAPGIGEYFSLGSEISLRLEKRTYPVRSLAALVGFESSMPALEALPQKSVLIAKAETESFAVLVDQIVDGRDLVLKSAGRHVKGIRGLSGVSVLGNGVVAPVLDLAEMLRSTHADHRVATSRDAMTQSSAKLPQVLIVDDSLSVRKSLMELVQDAGFTVHAAKDGLDAINAMSEFQPDIVLTDMEMPNMNGLELTTYLRGNDATTKLPIIMITSRSSEKHRTQAESVGVDVYLTKPYTDGDLLGHIHRAIQERAQ